MELKRFAIDIEDDTSAVTQFVVTSPDREVAEAYAKEAESHHLLCLDETAEDLNKEIHESYEDDVHDECVPTLSWLAQDDSELDAAIKATDLVSLKVIWEPPYEQPTPKFEITKTEELPF